MIVNEGFEIIGNRLLGVSENPVDTTYGTFGWSNGTSSPTLTDDRTAFEADGTGGSKTIESSSYSTKTITINCYLDSTEGNSPGSITKLAVYNASSGGKMLCEHKFDSITKNSDKELYATVTIDVSNA